MLVPEILYSFVELCFLLHMLLLTNIQELRFPTDTVQYTTITICHDM